MQKGKKFACRCCGFLTLDEEPLGTFEICPVCFWEDDYVQVIKPTWTGANNVTLSEAKENFARFGATEERSKPFVRAPYPDEYPSSIFLLFRRRGASTVLNYLRPSLEGLKFRIPAFPPLGWAASGRLHKEGQYA